MKLIVSKLLNIVNMFISGFKMKIITINDYVL